MPNRGNQNTNIVDPSEMPEELLHMEDWEDTVCALQQKYCYERSFLAEKLCNIEQLKYRQRDPSRRKTLLHITILFIMEVHSVWWLSYAISGHR